MSLVVLYEKTSQSSNLRQIYQLLTSFIFKNYDAPNCIRRVNVWKRCNKDEVKMC